jgi:hypothetical protein
MAQKSRWQASGKALQIPLAAAHALAQTSAFHAHQGSFVLLWDNYEV